MTVLSPEILDGDRHAERIALDRKAAKRALLDWHGEMNQIERFGAGLLPEDELLALARQVLFAPLAKFRRYSKLQAPDIKHTQDCSKTPGILIYFTRTPRDGILADEWRDLQAIRDAAHETLRVGSDERDPPFQGARSVAVERVVVDIVEHVGCCDHCRHRDTERRAASVRIEWAGHELVREYAMGGGK